MSQKPPGPILPDPLRARLLAWAFSHTRCWHLAEEAVQETQLALLQMNSPPEGDNLERWAFRVTRNKAVDQVRALPKPSTADPNLRDAGKGTPPTEDGAPGNLTNLIRCAVDELSRGLQDVVMLRLVRGRSPQETAELLGRTVNAVNTSLCRARARLRILLPPPYGEHADEQ